MLGLLTSRSIDLARWCDFTREHGGGKMARRFEKSGNLIFFYGGPGAPPVVKPASKTDRILEIVLVLSVLALATTYLAPQVLTWPAFSHTCKAVLNVVW